MSINELFNSNPTNGNTRTLSGTAALTDLAAENAARVIRAMEADIDNYRERITRSAKDSDELNSLLDEFKPWYAETPDELSDLEEGVVDGMLKSQQSKRSRAKSKAMTLDNYHTLLTAAIAEDILRDIYNKPKQAGGFRGGSSLVDFTPAQLEELAADQMRLRKEIRNIQSKKSIMKSKADFDAASAAWQQLLKAEAMLKDLRVGGRGGVVEVDHTKDALTELLGDIDTEHLKATDAKELLARIQEMTKE